MHCFRLSLFIVFILVWSASIVFAQETKVEEPSSKDKAASEKSSSIDDLSTSDFLNGKSSDPNQKDTNLFNSAEKTRVSWGSYLQMFVVLTFILFLIFLFFYFSKNKFRKNLMGLNGIEVLAKASLLPKQTILLVRIGPRVLVLNATNDGQMRTLTEFTNQDDIDRLLSEINKSSRDNIFQTLLTRNQVLYDEESPNEDKVLNKIDKETDKIQNS